MFEIQKATKQDYKSIAVSLRNKAIPYITPKQADRDIENGNLYIACPPLYRVYNSKKEIYCYDDTELEKAKAQIGAGYKVNRYKGLGEMNYTQLSETTMSREHRKLLRVVLKDDEDTSDKVSLFLGNNADRRKEWINNNIDFTTVDNFIKEVERNEK